MRVETISHSSGNQLPILLDEDGLPIPAPNEFVLSRRALATNTLTRNLNELAALYKWFSREGIDPVQRIASADSFKEAEIRGSLIEHLRRDLSNYRTVKKLVVSPLTFNQRLTTVRQYLGWLYEIYLGSMPHSDLRYERIRDQKNRLMLWLESAFINAPPSNKGLAKGLSDNQVKFLIKILDPNESIFFGRDPAVRFRNYISIMIMLNYGLRPGELLSLRVQDIEFGAISAIRITRRPDDPQDVRRPRPKIKRNGRVLPIDNPDFARHLDAYIMTWRDLLEAKSDAASDYLILSDEGKPLSQSSITQFFQIIRNRFPNELPTNLTAKSLRHTFSSNMEKQLRELGVQEDKRAEALAYLRGDSSLTSQLTYIMQEIEEQANLAMKKYHKKLLS